MAPKRKAEDNQSTTTQKKQNTNATEASTSTASATPASDKEAAKIVREKARKLGNTVYSQITGTHVTLKWDEENSSFTVSGRYGLAELAHVAEEDEE
ncbi:hypothetical protein F4779DRAFT_624413 [Xylariaceae sp. FL0662B]|nr:hypothetical protein F4779DRAFT_624413 [Xylariaceae sp. FL0662B]